LLNAAEQTSRIDDHGKRLDEPGGRIVLHGTGQANDGVPAHETVGIEHDHEVVHAAEPRDPLGNVAGFARGVVGAVAVVQPRHSDGLSQSEQRFFLGDPDVRIGAVAQNEPVEQLSVRRSLQGFDDRPEPGRQPVRVFVVGGKQHGGAACDGGKFRVKPEGVPIRTMGQQQKEASQRGRKRKGDPSEQDQE
jgi:hypothetical protein